MRLINLLIIAAGIFFVTDLYATGTDIQSSSKNYHIKSLEGVYEFKSGHEIIHIDKIEMELFRLAVKDVEGQKTIARLLGIDLSKKQVYEGTLDIYGTGYVYQAIDGELFVSSIDGEFTTVVPAGMILHVLKNVSQEDADTAKCPWCLGIGIAVAGNHLLCAATEGGTVAYCNATCRCGVASVHSTCLAGFRQTSCHCYPCQQTPVPPPAHPGFGGWGGPVFPGVTFGPNPNAPWVIPSEDDSF